MTSIRLGTFTRSVLLEVARERGALDAADIQVEESPVTSSPAQFSSLTAGELDAIFTSPDNVIAYRFLSANPLGRILDVDIVAGLDRGLGLAVATRPGLNAVAPGIRFGVDVPNSGFAFVGYALLERAGVDRDDVEIVTLGSTPARAQALLTGGCDATVLNAGNELRAQDAGASLRGSSADLGPYLGTVLARLGDAPAETVQAVDRLAQALVETAAGILDGSLHDAAVACAQRVLGLLPELAAEHVAVLRDTRVGLIADGAVDRPSLETLLQLRRRFLPDPDLDAVDLDAFTVPR